MNTFVEQTVIKNENIDNETRRYNDTVTWLAEVMPGSMYTPFEYTYQDGELYASDGSAMGKIFDDSIEHAKDLPNYELRRRLIEKQEYLDMIAMMRGDKPNTMVVVSDFPPELMNASEDVGGYNVTRKQTMLRVIARSTNGTLKMYSQSLDCSNRRALEAIYEYVNKPADSGELLGQRRFIEMDEASQEFLLGQLRYIYDRSMKAQFSGEWYAGRQNENFNDTYEFVCRQKDLLNAYLATTTSFTGGFRDYALAAAMKDRFEGKVELNIDTFEAGVVAHSMAIDEMYRAGNQAQARGEVFSGCGKSVGDPVSGGGESQMGDMGYGNQADKSSDDKDKLVWKDGICRVDNCPTRPGKTKVAQCSICRNCQSWFDKGRDPARLYRGVKRVQKESVTVVFDNKKQTSIKKGNQ